MNQNFVIAARRKLMAPANEPLTKFQVVVDFSITYQPYCAVFIANRLSAAFQINNGQAQMPQKAGTIQQRDAAIPVRPTMLKQLLGPLRPFVLGIGKRPA